MFLKEKDIQGIGDRCLLAPMCLCKYEEVIVQNVQSSDAVVVARVQRLASVIPNIRGGNKPFIYLFQNSCGVNCG